MKRFSITHKQINFRWIGVTILFVMISWLHMGPSLTHCGTTVLGRPGDHTAGIMYSSWVHPSSPLLGATTLTNYPFGENLWQPTALSSLVPSTSHLVLSRFTNIVCGWNLMVLFGYMSYALIMFGFMLWLTKNSWVALFAAYAVTYTPYHAFASRGQIAGLLGALFILALWQFIALWREPSWRKAVGLGTIFGVGFYTDGYFILFGGVMLLAFWIASISYGTFMVSSGRLAKIKPHLRSLALSSIVAFIFLLPLGWVNYHYALQINSYLGSTRGNIVDDAQTYSAELHMYFMPTRFFPVVGSRVQAFQSKYFQETGQPGLIFLGYSITVLACLGTWWMWRYYRSKSNNNINATDPHFFVGWTVLVLAFLALWISLKPKTSLMGISLHNPSDLIIGLTSSWRVFGRLYTLVDIGIVTLAGLGLLKLITKFHKQRNWIIGLCFLILVLELRSFPFSALTTAYNYHDSPPVYSWLYNNPEVRAIAEYPLDETPQGTYLGDYYTYQEISNKPLLNSFLPNSPEASLRRSIAGINDPQTIPVLRSLGIGLVNVRVVNPYSNAPLDIRKSALSNNSLKMLFSYKSSYHPIDSFLIEPGQVANYALVIASLQYYQISLTANGSADYLMGSNTELRAVKLPGATRAHSTVTVSFNIRAEGERQATITQSGKIIWSGYLHASTQTIQLKISVTSPITIISQETTKSAQLYISRLQVLD